jgi:peptidoglycan/LPS O-acetylase OafA/YrhL
MASILMALTLKFPFFTGNKIDATITPTDALPAINAHTNIWLLVIACSFVAICFIVIFLFKNRKLQMQLVTLAIILGLVNLFLLYNETHQFTNGTYSISAILPIFAIGFCISALHSVWKDEKKIKELNSNRIR